MRVDLAYGKTGHIIELSDDLNIDIIEPLWVDKVNDPGYAITEIKKTQGRRLPCLPLPANPGIMIIFVYAVCGMWFAIMGRPFLPLCLNYKI